VGKDLIHLNNILRFSTVQFSDPSSNIWGKSLSPSLGCISPCQDYWLYIAGSSSLTLQSSKWKWDLLSGYLMGAMYLISGGIGAE
jgi:hypothetical protein